MISLLYPQSAIVKLFRQSFSFMLRMLQIAFSMSLSMHDFNAHDGAVDVAWEPRHRTATKIISLTKDKNRALPADTTILVRDPLHSSRCELTLRDHTFMYCIGRLAIELRG